MGHEYHAFTNESAETVVTVLREIATSVSCAKYCSDIEFGVSFNYELSEADSNWGDDIEVSFVPIKKELYILNSFCPDQNFVNELKSLFETKGICLTIEEL